MPFFKLSSEETTVTLNIGESHKHNKQKKPDTPKKKKRYSIFFHIFKDQWKQNESMVKEVRMAVILVGIMTWRLLGCQ